jgi:hypothetical protein
VYFGSLEVHSVYFGSRGKLIFVFTGEKVKMEVVAKKASGQEYHNISFALIVSSVVTTLCWYCSDIFV